MLCGRDQMLQWWLVKSATALYSVFRRRLLDGRDPGLQTDVSDGYLHCQYGDD